MKKFGIKRALTSMLLLGLGALLAGCTTLTEEAPEPTVSAHLATPPAPTTEADPEWESTQFVDPLTGTAPLKPENGQKSVLEVSGSGDGGGAIDRMSTGETFVMWTCAGTGPITIRTSDGSQTDAECGDSDVGQVSMSSFVNHDLKKFDVDVTADPGASWHVLVTQPAL